MRSVSPDQPVATPPDQRAALKRRVLRSSAWSLFGGGGQQAISLLLFFYLARLLTPGDIGLIAFAMVFVDLLSFATRCGQVELIQRQPEVDDGLLSTSFWLLAAGGFLASAALLAGSTAAPGILGGILAFLAPIIALQALNALPEALMKRRLEFRSLAIRSWAGTLAGGATALALVHQGYGVEALVGQRLVTAAVQTMVLWMLLDWRPVGRLDPTRARFLIREGGLIMLGGCSNILNPRVTDTIIGATLGAGALGVFRLTWRFFEFVHQFAVVPVSGVALSTFSKMQSDRAMLSRAYLRLTQFVAVGAVPVFFGFGAIADVAIPLAFGEKWSEAVTPVSLLGLVVLPGTVNFFFGPAMLAVGESAVVLRQSLAQVVLTMILVALGVQYGLTGVLVAIIVRVTVVSLYNLYLLRRFVGLQPMAVIAMLTPPAAGSAAMVATVWWVKLAVGTALPTWALLAILVVVGALTYGAVIAAGDALGLWRGYVRSAVESVRHARGSRGDSLDSIQSDPY